MIAPRTKMRLISSYSQKMIIETIILITICVCLVNGQSNRLFTFEENETNFTGTAYIFHLMAVVLLIFIIVQNVTAPPKKRGGENQEIGG